MERSFMCCETNRPTFTIQPSTQKLLQQHAGCTMVNHDSKTKGREWECEEKSASHTRFLWNHLFLTFVGFECINFPGLAHIEATVHALVGIIQAFMLCDSQYIGTATKHLVQLLLCPVSEQKIMDSLHLNFCGCFCATTFTVIGLHVYWLWLN